MIQQSYVYFGYSEIELQTIYLVLYYLIFIRRASPRTHPPFHNPQREYPFKSLEHSDTSEFSKHSELLELSSQCILVYIAIHYVAFMRTIGSDVALIAANYVTWNRTMYAFSLICLLNVL